MDLSSAAASDLPAVAALVNAAYRGGESGVGWTHEDFIEGRRVDAETLARDLAARPDAALLVLRGPEGGAPVACVWLEPVEADVWRLGLLSVKPELQDQGLGRQLVQAGEAHALLRGARRMRLVVVNVRAALISWYERQGYVRTGQTQPFPYQDQRFGRPLRDDLAFVVLEKAL